MEKKCEIYGKARLITWLCYAAIICTFISLTIEVGKNYLSWNTIILERIVNDLWNLLFAAILLVLKDYTKKFYKKTITTLAVVALIYFIVVPLDAIVKLYANDGLMILSVILILAFPVLLLISGVQVNRIKKERKIGTSLIIYASLMIVAMLICSRFISENENEFPLWFYFIGTIIDIGLLFILGRKFSKMPYNKRKAEIQQ
ncbi:MAG: hypothetical protein PHP31_07015 [Lentimicrobiaceae bacterium]|nr:hypothetical protein [Lentimicrobiaceae bacterium]